MKYEHIPFGSNVSRMHSYSSVSVSTRKLKCLASCTNYKDIIAVKIWKTGYVTLNTPILGVIGHRMLGFDTVYLHAKFDDSSFSRSRDIIGDVKI